MQTDTDIPTIRWKYIDGFNQRYQVSQYGDVRDKDKGTILRTRVKRVPHSGSPYLEVYLVKPNGQRQQYRVAILVLTAHKRPKEPGESVRYRDNDPLNVGIDNLYWGSYSYKTAEERRKEEPKPHKSGFAYDPRFKDLPKEKKRKVYGRLYQRNNYRPYEEWTIFTLD